MKNTPLAIPRDEWKEIAQLPVVQRAFESEHISAGDLADIVYGAKFDFSSSEEMILYTLVGIYSTKKVLLILTRENGILKEMGK